MGPIDEYLGLARLGVLVLTQRVVKYFAQNHEATDETKGRDGRRYIGLDVNRKARIFEHGHTNTEKTVEGNWKRVWSGQFGLRMCNSSCSTFKPFVMIILTGLTQTKDVQEYDSWRLLIGQR